MKTYKYEKIIEYIQNSIKKSIIPFGTKLPSLRKIQKQFDCSMSVAKQAYQELEMQGVVQAIEKSGFFVKPSIKRPSPTPQKEHYSLKSSLPVEKSIMNRVIDAGNNPKIISFGAGIPDKSILPVKKLQKTISQNAKEFPDLLCNYTPFRGNLLLRQALVKFLFNKGISVNSEEIMITNGCMEALSLAIRSTTQEGDTIVIENPVFFGLINLLKHLNRRVIEIPTDPIRGIDLNILEEVVSKKRVKICIVSASFQNPLGFIMSTNDKQKILELSEKYAFLIVENDIYSETGYSQNNFRSIRSFDSKDRVLYCSSFSKAISPGIRIGWIIAGKYLHQCELIKSSESLGGVNLLQKSMADFLNKGGYDFFIKKFRKKLAEQMYEIKNKIIDLFPKNIKISNPLGGFYLWVELPSHIDSIKLFEDSFAKNIGIVPGVAFTTSNRYLNCIRISCGAPVTDKTINAIKILANLINSY